MFGALIVSLLPIGGCEAICANNVMGDFPSPDRAKRVVIFSRSCGYSWNVSILGANEQLANDKGGTVTVGPNSRRAS
jgi:hypothetical protein